MSKSIICVFYAKIILILPAYSHLIKPLHNITLATGKICLIYRKSICHRCFQLKIFYLYFQFCHRTQLNKIMSLPPIRQQFLYIQNINIFSLFLYYNYQQKKAYRKTASLYLFIMSTYIPFSPPNYRPL